MELLIALLFGIFIAALISGFIIWVVGKLDLGLSVDSFGSAMLAGLVIGIISGIVHAVVGEFSGLVGALVNLVISAVVILLAGNMLKGINVKGFSGALLAAVAIAVVSWLLAVLLVGMIGVGVLA